MSDTAVVLIAHGTVDSLDELPEFLTNIRRGHPPPAELVAEVRRRYEAIGGRSPLLDVTRALAQKLEAELALPVRAAMRLFHPYPEEVLADLLPGIRRVVALPLAQHSAAIYADAVRAAAKELDPSLEVLAAKNWGRRPELTRAFVERVTEALAKVPAGELARCALVFTAHSLPVSIVRAGDPYERDFRASVEDVVVELRRRAAVPEHVVAFQSQGLGAGAEWLGPDLKATIEELARRGKRHAVLAPVGFLADHVEILYDLDIEAKRWCADLGIAFHRSASLNAGDDLAGALAAVAREVLTHHGP